MRTWVKGALALAAAGLVAQPAAAQLAYRFVPGAEAVPASGPRLPLGKCVNLSNMLDAPMYRALPARTMSSSVRSVSSSGVE